MSSVQIEQKSYEMPPKEGISIAHFLTAGRRHRAIGSLRYDERSSGARILSLGDGNAPSACTFQLANIWMILRTSEAARPRISRR